jgi:hypothetical protein
MRSHLSLLEVWLTCHLPYSTLVRTSRTKLFVLELWIKAGNLGLRNCFVLFDLEVELLNMIKLTQIVKVRNWVAFNFVHKGSNVGLVFKWKTYSILDSEVTLLERKSEANAINVVVVVLVIFANIRQLGSFTVILDPLFAFFTVGNIIILKSLLDFLKTEACTPSHDHLV